MPYSDLGSNILVFHHIGDIHYQIEKSGLGDCSVELAVWLDAKHRESQWRAQGATDADISQTFIHSREAQLLATRAHVAAVRGYRPRWADMNGQLTPVGQSKLTSAVQAINSILEETDNEPFQPKAWQTAEQAYLRAVIPKRTLKLLTVIKQAIHAAEHKYNEVAENEQDPTTLAKHARDLGLTVPGLTPEINRTHTQPSNTHPLPAFQPVPFTQANMNMPNVVQDVESRDTLLFRALLATRWDAWVPASMFTSTTRHDMFTAYRYGLVDLHAFNSGTRGRPRLIIRVSSVANMVLADLARRKLI